MGLAGTDAYAETAEIGAFRQETLNFDAEPLVHVPCVLPVRLESGGLYEQARR